MYHLGLAARNGWRSKLWGMSLTLRPATNADTDAVVYVIRAVYDEYGFPWEPEGYHADLYDLDGHYARAGHVFFVAEIDGQPVGTAALALHDPIPLPEGSCALVEGFVRVGGTDCSLERLYVHPDARRKGVGQALLTRVMDEARARGRRSMELWSDKKFFDAHRLYERLGARVVGERLCHDPDQSPEWGLILPL